MPPDQRNHPLRRHALGLWFCGLGLLGLLRCWMRIARTGGFHHTTDWLWLIGSLAVIAVGLFSIARNHRRRTGSD
ncbi:hypothetical protein [Lysobacter niastensis]|uniref:DUF202 domain-containing protein n=1 Tax=Lysobacter niastensis TaxID=380629 RepID=A0ABS0B2M5_9GAMM|nr:hypothetical protein [Lysobacter niastensis]MBF6022738.1 hypothetical protein [Lysobacter niastensis]